MPPNPMTTIARPRQEFVNGFRDIAPLTFGVIVYGLAFGLLASQAKMSELQTGIMGALVFAGSSQIVGIERLVAGAGAISALVAGLTLNVRILLMTASLREELSMSPWWQILRGVHLTSDENWALMHTARAKGQTVGYWYLVGGGASLLIFWVLATTLGVGFARALPEPRAIGIDFAFTAAFIAMARAMWRGRQNIAPWVVTFAVTVLLVKAGIESAYAILLASLCGVGLAAFLRRQKKSEETP